MDFLLHATDKFTFDHSDAVKSAINTFLEITEREKDRKVGHAAVHGVTKSQNNNKMSIISETRRDLSMKAMMAPLY